MKNLIKKVSFANPIGKSNPNVYLLTLFVLACSFLSCSSDNSNDEVPLDNVDVPLTKDIYKLTSIVTANAYDLNADGVESNDVLAETNCMEGYTLTFNSDDSGVRHTPMALILFYVSADDQFSMHCLSTEELGAEEYTDFRWTENNNSITYQIDGVDHSGEISGSELKFTVPEGFAYQIQTAEGEAGEVITEEAVLTFTKQ